MASIEWSKLPGGQSKFDEVVEAFFVKEYAVDSGDTYAVNGRGGDGGIDIHISHNAKTIIAQLKFFPEGFSGGFREVRQKQIRRSFKSAVAHPPDEWWLVVPSTLTPNEREYVLGLPGRQKPPMANLQVRIYDRPQLDALAAKHPDLVTYFNRDELLEAAQIYNQERALLVNQDDVVARVAALAKQSDTLHPDWRLDLFTQGDLVGTMLTAKHPLAAERSPVTITVGAKFSPGQEDLRRKLDRMTGYGTPEQIDLPASVITTFVVDGPEFIAHSSDNVEVSYFPVESVAAGEPFAVELHDPKDKTVATYSGKTMWTGKANLGVSLKADFYNTVTLEFLLPFDRSSGPSMTAGVDLAGSDPTDIVKAVSMLERFDTEHGAKLIYDGTPAASILLREQDQSAFGDHREAILLHKAIAEDLVYVQAQTNQYFPYPNKIDPSDRIYLRCLRRMLEGRCIVLPEKHQVNMTLNGEDHETARRLLAGDTMSVVIDQENFGFEVFGREFHLGFCRIYAPQVAALGANGLQKELDPTDAEGRQVTLRTQDSTGFWVFSMDRVVKDADGQIRPTGLDLPEYPDAPDVAQALEEAK